ncbi:MAG TPA: indolepyruvate ferredoxin oxidoreductase subunit alpha [Candidatus Bathyarchaeota archaeon]|nr:indolepyruvate ferredoxin oxidoreductase subunit alpha [Candidatus Bathyarchaeota archaeon]
MPNSRLILQDAPGKRVLLLGNEAIARGILEAGIGVMTTYPGTPASEIGDTVSKIAAEAGLYMEYSTNEIVAVEVAAGAANSGVRALTAMKHVGLNVAADAVMTLAYVGVKGGYVIVTADDPECYSSQNEQDNRYYALLSGLPCLEPSNAQEAKEMTISAVEISEKLELPVLLRTTTRISHTRGPVTYGRLVKPNLKGEFVKDVKRMVMVPANARPMHVKLLEKMEKAKEITEKTPYNAIIRKGNGEYGIISSSSAYNYAVEAANLLELDASILKLGMTHPLPEKMIAEFLNNHKKVIVVEELEPYLETHVKAIAKDYAPNVEIYGKTKEKYFPRKGELSTRLVAMGLAKITGKKPPIDFEKIDAAYAEIAKTLPSRPPILCPGCPHTASFYVIGRATGKKAIYTTDIGCYALGIMPPLNIGDILICMGASIATAQGISKTTGKDTIAVIGDSTFFHAAIPGLINAVYNNHKVVLAVLDNLTTAMTGHQPHPGTGKTGMQAMGNRVLVEKVAEGCGVKYVKVVNPFKTKEAETVLKEALQHPGPAVIVFRAPCALMTVRDKRRKGIEIKACKITDQCTDCMACINLLGCPALTVDEGKVRINEALCVGCGLCASVCPYNAIACSKTD